jgi:hypothetical protein
MFESKAADQFASLPSLHVTWALWVAVALWPVLRRHRVLRAAVWLYPAATILDVLVTANHYLLDVILAPGVLLLGSLGAAMPGLVRRWLARRRAPAPAPRWVPVQAPAVRAPDQVLTGARTARALTGASRVLAGAGYRPATADDAGGGDHDQRR